LPERITTIFVEIEQIIQKYQPDVVVIERAFMRPDRPNPDAAIKLGHARGAIISAAGSNHAAMVEYSPNQIKKAVVGKGHATKEQVSFMVQELLKLNKVPQADAADALAGAICHAYHCL
jgi:crossover junction endodeoxyribonuclease RuvC